MLQYTSNWGTNDMENKGVVALKELPKVKRRLDINIYINLYIHTLYKHMQKIISLYSNNILPQ